MDLPTIKIKTEYGRGWAIINQSDFNPNVHQVFDGPQPSSGDVAMTDADLRAAIEKATGKAPHHKTGRAKLIALHQEATK